jgi:hypothetical protein
MARKSKQLKVYWIDDDSRRVAPFVDIFENERAVLEPLTVDKDTLVLTQIGNWLQKAVPHLVLVDHKFNLGAGFALNGATCAHILRRKWRRVPFVCVTAQFDSGRPIADSFDTEDMSEYSLVLPFDGLADRIDLLKTIARQFPSLVRAIGDPARLCRLLGVPAHDKEIAIRAMPDEFKQPGVPTTAHRLARWILRVLLDQPGFLYDRLRVATMLGLTETGFAKIEKRFAECRYTGIFADGFEDRWWRSAVHAQVHKLVGANSPAESWLAGRKLRGVKKQDFSTCYVSGKENVPDLVAITMPDGTPRAVCSRFTVPPDPATAWPAGFEQVRVITDNVT